MSKKRDNQRQATTAIELDYAWAAGFFDGEGCVSVTRYVYKNGTPHIDLVIHITQKDPRPLARFHQIFADIDARGFAKVKRGPKVWNTKQYPERTYWRLQWGGFRAAEVLRRMLPYLTLKKEVAETGIALVSEIHSFTRAERWHGIPRKSYEYRQELYERVKWLNTGRWAAVETKRAEQEQPPVCDSPVCNDGKVAEDGRNDRPPTTFH